MQPLAMALLVGAHLSTQVARQYDAPILENPFLRAHIVTLNTVEHYRSTVDGPQLFYCLGSFVAVRSDGDAAGERCMRGQLLFQESGWLDFKADGDARPDMLIVEIKQAIAGDFFVARDDATKVVPDAYRVMLDNPVLRVVEMRIAAGQRLAPHRQPPRTLLFPLTAASLKLTMPGGRVQDVTIAARVPRWTVDSVEHAVANSGTTELRALLVALK